MLPPIESMTFPSKCPFPSCRTKLHREWVLGVTPKFLGMINAVIRCKNCERVYCFTMPVTAVEPFVQSLPLDKSFPFDITKKMPKEEITNEEMAAFEKKQLGPKETKAVIEAFSVLDEYDSLGYYGKTERKDLSDIDPDDTV